ncbi:MAG: hypothetical protein ABSF43_04675 [Rectinemataceae bacterium]|jgi:hypothetical protein
MKHIVRCATLIPELSKGGPIGSVAITVAGAGSAFKSAAAVLRALEASGLQVRAFFAGEGTASFRVLVEASRGDEALRLVRESLGAPHYSS